MKLIKVLSLVLFIFCVKKITSQNIYKDTLDIKKLVSQAKKYALIKNYSEAIILCKKIISNRNNEKDLAFDYYRLGFYFKKNNQLDSTYIYYIKSKKMYLSIDDSLMVAERLFNIAKIESNNELYLQSDSTAISALKYLNNNDSERTSIYNCLGINARKQKKYKEAIDWYNKALNNVNDVKKKIRYKNNIANVYRDMKKSKESLNIYNNIFEDEYFDSIKTKTKLRIKDNYLYTKWLNSKDIDISKGLIEITKTRERIKDYLGLNASYSHLSDFYKETNYRESLKYAYKMYNLSKKERLLNNKIRAIDRIIELEKASKIRNFAIERAYLTDSIQQAKSVSKNKLVTVIYNFDEEKKQKLKAKAELADSKLILAKQKNQKQFWIFIGLTSFLGFVSYVFYKRNKTKKEKIVEVYNTETRLAKKIHDVLANDMYLVMNKLQKEKRENTSILYDLEKIYTLTRNISRENSPVITGKFFEGFLKQLFIDFTTNTCKIMNRGLSEVNLNVLQKEKQIVLYRLLQELLVNMKKHSQASLVIVAFSEIKDTLKVEYKDNGVGVDTIEMKSGLKNMETRIKSIGGTITFELETQKGFHVTFRFKK